MSSEWNKGKGNAWQQATSKRWDKGRRAVGRGGNNGHHGQQGIPGGKGKGFGKAATSSQQPGTQQPPAQAEEADKISQRLGLLHGYIQRNERFVDNDPALAKIVEEWRSEQRSLLDQRNVDKPRDQRLRELLTGVATAKKELTRLQDMAEAARVGMEAAKSAHQERVKMVERKEVRLAELEEQRAQMEEESPPAGAPKDVSPGDTLLTTKEQLAYILAAAGGAEAAQGERLDQSWAKYQEAVAAKQKQERDHALEEQRKQEEQQKSAAMEVDTGAMEELQSSLDDMLQIDGVEIPSSLREALEKRKAQLVEAAKAKRPRLLFDAVVAK